jgi:hypothetical protein
MSWSALSHLTIAHSWELLHHFALCSVGARLEMIASTSFDSLFSVQNATPRNAY